MQPKTRSIMKSTLKVGCQSSAENTIVNNNNNNDNNLQGKENV